MHTPSSRILCALLTFFSFLSVFFFNDTATTEIYTLSLHDALPISTANPGALVYSFNVTLQDASFPPRSEEHTSELQSLRHLVCRLLLEKKTNNGGGHHGLQGRAGLTDCWTGAVGR